MGRERKFRAWDKVRKKMWTFKLFNNDEDYICTEEEGYCSLYAEDCNIMQYTGLKDKNGKEIYEGDICFVMGNKKPIGVVEYLGMAFEFRQECMPKSGDGKRNMLQSWVEIDGKLVFGCEVLGNIYETPELKGVVDESQDYTSWHGKPIQLKGE